MPTTTNASIAKLGLALSGISALNKTYDGTTAATMSGSASVTALGGDDVSVAGSGTASFAEKNAGAAKAVAITGYTLSGTDAGTRTLHALEGLWSAQRRASMSVLSL